jgi:integrase
LQQETLRAKACRAFQSETAGYNVVTTPKRRPKVRPYAKDYLTRTKGGVYTIQRRIPDHLIGTPPFGTRTMFKRTTGTTDLAEARLIRDAVFKQVGFESASDEKARKLAEKGMGRSDFYFEAHNSVSGTYEELIAQSETLDEYAQDAINPKTEAKYAAQRDALVRKAHETITKPYEMIAVPHRYELTLGEAKTKYKVEMEERELTKKTVAKLETAFNRYIAFAGSNPLLSDITLPRVRQFVRHLREAGLSASTTSNDLTFLGSAFQFAQEEGFLDPQVTNPFRGHRLSGFAKKIETQRFNEKQILSLLVGCTQDSELRAFIYLGYYTGMRLEEAYSAKLVDIDGLRVWDVASEGGKNESAPRKVPVGDSLWKALEELGYSPKLDHSVPWKTASAGALGKRFGRLKKRVLKDLGADDKPYMYHSFRHGFITQLLEQSYHELEVADLTGHSKSKGSTEAGRTYFKKQLLPKLTTMVNAIKPIPSPQELAS